MSKDQIQHKQQARLLKLLIKVSEGGLPVQMASSKIMMSFKGRNFSFPKDIFVQCIAGKMIVENDGNLEITDIGRVIARQLLYPDIEFETPMQSRNNTTNSAASSSNLNSRNTGLNLSESPQCSILPDDLAVFCEKP